MWQRATTGASGGGDNYAYATETISPGVRKDVPNFNNGFYTVISNDGSPNYYTVGYVKDGVRTETGRNTGFSSSYSNGTLTLTNTRTSGTYLLEMFHN